MDIKALQDFMNTWKPVVEAIPAVIQVVTDTEYYEKQKAQVQREIAILVEEFEKTKGIWAKAEADWGGRLAELQAQIAVASTAVSDANAQAKREAAAANKRAKDAEKAADERVVAAVAGAKAAEESAEMSVLAANESARARVAAAESAAEEAEKRYAATLKKLETLKASLGA